jgi:hypothetical protein
MRGGSSGGGGGGASSFVGSSRVSGPSTRGPTTSSRMTGMHVNKGHGHGHHHRHRIFVSGVGWTYLDYPYTTCWQWVHVKTRHGWRWRHVYVCG